MEYTYKANEVTYEDAPKKKLGKKRSKITSVSEITSPKRLKYLLAEKTDHIFLEPNWYVMDDSTFDGCLEKAPTDQVFIIEGDEEDWDAVKTPRNPIEVQMLSEFGPPKIHWIVQIEWIETEGRWAVTKESIQK